MGIMTGDKKGFKKSDRCVCEGLYFFAIYTTLAAIYAT